MGTIRSKVKLTNEFDLLAYKKGYIAKEQIRSLEIVALVDTGAYLSVIPLSIFDELGLEIEEYETAKFADGRTEVVVLSSVVKIQFENRSAIINPMVLGDEVLIGATTLQLLDVILDPVEEKMMVNPLSPNSGLFRV